MKPIKTFGLIVLLCMMVSPVFAQRRFNPDEMAKRQSSYVIDNISSLTAAQKDSVQAIYATFATDIQNAFNNNSGDRQAMRDQMTQLRTQRDKELQAVLTPDQFKQYQDLMAKARNSRRRNRQ